MSVSGLWIMSAVPPGVLESLRADIDVTQFEPPDADSLDWWAAMDHAPLTGPDLRRWSSEAAEWFAEALDALRPDCETIERCIDAMRETVDDIHYVAIARKGDPFAALCYGLTSIAGALACPHG